MTSIEAAALSAEWPIVRRYSGPQRNRIRLPLGGIGTGCISVDGRGRLVDVEIANEPAYGYTPQRLFAALRVAGDDGHVDTRLLEGELFDHEYEGAHGSPTPQHGLPRFRECTFAASYPFARIDLADPAVPLAVAIEAVNPMIPGDADASGHPALRYRVRLANTTSVRQSAAVVFNLPNVIGATLRSPAWPGTTFAYQDDPDGSLILGRNPRRDGTPGDGTIAIHTPGRTASSFRTNWIDRPWSDALAEFWDDFAQDGDLDHPAPGGRDGTGSLVLRDILDPGSESTMDFVLAWHFPYRRAWTHRVHELDRPSQHVVGNHYATRTPDAGEAAVVFGRLLPSLVEQSTQFVQSIVDTGMPTVLVDAALSNLAVMKSPTVFRTADGRFYAWEGTNDDSGSCQGTSTHVWNYEYATVDLFEELAWTMRETEFLDSLDERGLMSFRAGLPRDLEGTSWRFAAADGQMGSIIRFHRTWRRTEDDERARRLWPNVRRAMEFAWIEGGWDADRDGVMEGCQHNTFDVESYGPTSRIQSYYLGALAAAEDLADHFGDEDFAKQCRRLLTSGCAWMDEHLFNGQYYQQTVVTPESFDAIAPALRLENIGEGGSRQLKDPDYQIGSGCTSDQLAGVALARLSGLEVPLNPEHVHQALLSVARNNHIDRFHDHVNPSRSYALGDERGLLNASYPLGRELAYPFPYWTEVWTGFEYSAAVGLLLVGERDLAIRTVTDVRNRYDGSRRNPFNEVECGHHYARAMASWGLVEAWRTMAGGGTP